MTILMEKLEASYARKPSAERYELAIKDFATASFGRNAPGVLKEKKLMMMPST